MLIGLIKTLLYILFFYYAVKVFTRLVAPFLMRYAAKKMQEKFKNQMGKNFSNRDSSPKAEGEIHIKSKKKSSKSSTSDSIGDYVDFEEVQD
tara:strand:- start:319 stop:594 length:276 start_codon:yes stop_codon:yes gene_type:complete